jgi:hypothetical protein
MRRHHYEVQQLSLQLAYFQRGYLCCVRQLGDLEDPD